ncbi:MAG TPA: GTP 3',8-cyclase MoaA [Phycisphaerales bacterium]|nr:GTP 3',8-cyclase MoaA [Phycisphaerales bacterium]
MRLSLPVIESEPEPVGPTPSPARTPRPTGLIDSHGRTIRDLRLSLTDRCNFRCVYCMEPDQKFMPTDRVMQPAEIERIARMAISLGVRTIRLTGGEPTVRPDLISIVKRLSRLDLDDLAMTTNGACDPDLIPQLRRAGLRRITFSLDTLDPDLYATMTRSRIQPEQVVQNIQRAAEIGLDPVRINAVILKDVNESSIIPLVEMVRTIGVELRFIEFMPLDGARGWGPERFVPNHHIRELIEQRYALIPLRRDHRSATAHRFAFADGTPGGIGCVSPVSEPFCGQCSRLRITANGQVVPCLFGRAEADLLHPMRAGADDATIAGLLWNAVERKQAGHGIGTTDFERPSRAMNAIGG